MRYTHRHGFLWLLIYCALALTPLLLALVGELPAVRDFWIELGVGFGFIGLGILGLQFIFTGRFQKIAAAYSGDNVMQFHKQIGIISFLFVLAHPITLILADASFLSYFNPKENFMRALSLSAVLIFLIAIVASSIWRQVLRLSYEKWRIFHGFLALAIVFIGVVHSIQVSHYLDPLWKKIGLAVMMACCMYLVIHTRIIRPWMNKKKRYKIIAVKAERDECYTIDLQPLYGKRMEFIPGQYCWITIDQTPFSLQQHPFSFVSSSSNPNIQLTAKALGDFTQTWKDLPENQLAYLEGPFGAFTMDAHAPLFLIMGGIGVTPAMSMLRTLRDKKDLRKAILIYANKDWESITFREELEDLRQEINLTVIHVLEEADKNWKGETGFVNEDLLKRHFPEDKDAYKYFICGPSALMDVTEIALHNLGLDWRQIYSERFEMV